MAKAWLAIEKNFCISDSLILNQFEWLTFENGYVKKNFCFLTFIFGFQLNSVNSSQCKPNKQACEQMKKETTLILIGTTQKLARVSNQDLNINYEAIRLQRTTHCKTSLYHNGWTSDLEQSCWSCYEKDFNKVIFSKKINQYITETCSNNVI